MMRIKQVVVGGGFAGLNFIMQIQNRLNFSVTLVDQNNYNFFPPLLYQVATGFLEPSAISYPYRRFLRNKKNIHFKLGKLTKIETGCKKVHVSGAVLNYDLLVLAHGVEINYFGNEDFREKFIPMKTLSDALAMRNIFLSTLEKACGISDRNGKAKLLSMVIIGAGPTGVEIAGMLSEMRKNILYKDYPELIGDKIEIYLADGVSSVLPGMKEKSQHYTAAKLKQMGIKLKLGFLVTGYKEDKVIFSDGSSIVSKTVIWAAGVTGTEVPGIPQHSYGKGKRILVDAYNKVRELDDVYAIGDICFQNSDPAFPKGHPQVAKVAIQQGKLLAKNLSSTDPMKPFVYNDKGSMAIIGQNKAVAEVPKLKLNYTGFIAWLTWLFVHIMSLLNYRNRLRTLYNWAGFYINRDQFFRMIIKPSNRNRSL